MAQPPSHRQKRAHDGQLPQLHADVEAAQRGQQRTGGQAQVEQDAGKAKAVHKTKHKGQTPALEGAETQQIVQRGQHHRNGNGWLHQIGGRREPARDGQAQRDGVRHREGRDDRQHVQHHGPSLLGRLPIHHLLARRLQGGQHQEAEQEDDVVDADPDVPHALEDVAPKHFERAVVCAADAGLWPFRAEQSTALVVPQIHLEQAAVQTVLRKDQVITQRQTDIGRVCCRGQPRATHDPLGAQVGAIGVLAGLQVCAAQGALLSSRSQGNALRQPVVQLGASRLRLAPSDLAIAVGVEVKNQVKVPHVDIGPECQRGARRAEREVAVAAGVRLGHRGAEQAEHSQSSSHPPAPRHALVGRIHHGRPPVQLG